MGGIDVISDSIDHVSMMLRRILEIYSLVIDFVMHVKRVFHHPYCCAKSCGEPFFTKKVQRRLH